MTTYELIITAVSLLTLGGVGYLIAKFPRTALKTRQRAILVDTSVIIDGRITAVAATGFIGGSLVIPRSVIGELQLLADGSDSEKRARARRGLDIVSELQHTAGLEVEILQDSVRADEGVDNRLLSLAKRHNAAICTLDFNLNKVAVVEGIRVLNVNELAQSLRMSHLPGEHIIVELTQKGQDNHQAVGHLPDGTMVVVEQASSRIGQMVEIEIIRSLQTAAGRMMFAKVIDKTPRPNTQAPRASSSRNRSKRQAPVQPQLAPVATPAPVVVPKPVQASTPRQPEQRTASQEAPKPRNGRAYSSRRQPSQRDREASLMALVDKQS